MSLFTVNGNRCLPAPIISEKYKVGKVIGDGNFAVVKECVERWVTQIVLKYTVQLWAVITPQRALLRSLMSCVSGAELLH